MALTPGSAFPADDAADLAGLAKLAEDCERFSPLVGWETVNGPATQPDNLYLDVTGTRALFGGEDALVREVLGCLAQQGFTARVAVADRIGEAWAKAVYQEPLPVSALRLTMETVDLLAQLGITEVEQLLKLPRASLPARFGEQLVLRLGQFQGTVPETIVAHRPPPAFVAETVLEHPAESLEVVEKIVCDLIGRMAELLAERRQGAVRLTCRLFTPTPQLIQVGLFRPSAKPQHLWDVLRLQLQPAGPVSRIQLSAPVTAPLENRQRELFAGNQEEADRQFGLLIDRLNSRLGPDSVLRPEPTADPLPERAVEYVPMIQPPKRRKAKAALHRPLLLFKPFALEVISIAPNGPPMAFRLNRRPHKVVRWWGPERIESGWWRGPSVRRDYYRVETGEGRYWLYRRLQDGQWFLHGEFA